MTRRHSLLGLLVLALALQSAVVRADDASEARLRYERAIKLYEDGVYDAALVELTRAYELNPSFKVLYNVGQVRLAMQDHAGALEAFTRYLQEGGEQIPRARVLAVERERERLEQRVARLLVEADQRDAEVLIDDLLVGTTPLASPLLVNSGLRRVMVRHPAHPPQSELVSVAGGEQRTVRLSLRPHVDPAPATSPLAATPASSEVAPRLAVALPAQTGESASESRPASSSSSRRARQMMWLSWSATGALLGGGIGLAFATRASQQNFNMMHDQFHHLHDLEDAAEKTQRLAYAADALFGASIIAAGVSLWLTLRADGNQERAATSSRALRSTPGIALHARGIGLRTEF